jgi:hypothetical protein
MRRIIEFAFFLIIHGNCYAQETNSKWEANLIYSFGIPTGAFGAVDPTTSVSYVSPNVPQLSGFDKKGHAAALNGSAIDIRVNYLLSKNFIASLGLGTASHSVNVSPLNNYLYQSFSGNGTGYFSAVQWSYRNFSIAPGISYQIQSGKWFFRVTQLVGLAVMEYPDYYMDFYFNGVVNSVVKHEGSKPNSKSLWVSSNLSVNRWISQRVFVGVNTGYSIANFPYQITLRLVPGGNPTPTRYDEVPWRTIGVGLVAGYRF